MDAADPHSASGRTSVRHSFHSQQQSISENFDREAARASRGSPSSSRQAGSRGGSCTRRPAASTASSGAAAKPCDHRFQRWPFKCSRAEFQSGKHPGANPTPDRIGHRRLEPRPASLWAIWPWKCFRNVCLPCLMAQDMTLSSSAEAIATLPLGSSCRRPVALPLQLHLHRQLQTRTRQPRQKAMMLNRRTRQLRRRQSHRRKFLMKCAEGLLNDGGRASEKILARSRDGAEQRGCASEIRTVFRSRTAVQQVYGLADLV